MLVFALPNCGVLVKLNISARNCAFQFSPQRKFLRIARSAWFVGPNRMLGIQRGALPSSKLPGVVKAAVLNQRSGVGLAIAAAFKSATFGR